MARISQFSKHDSWHVDGVLRRDKRAAKSPGDEEMVPGRAMRKKNTKRWCKGYPGREHVLVWVEVRRNLFGNHRYLTHLEQRCAKCKKTMAYCWGTAGTKCQKHGERHPIAEVVTN